MRPIRVKIVKESKEKLTVMMIATNRAMPVKRDEFEARLEEGVYELVETPKPPAPAEEEDEE